MMNKILVIEDEREINNVIYEYLVNEGYTVKQAFDGIEGLLNFDQTINLVILDVMMPKLDGYNVLQELRKTSDVPVLMLTALDQEEDVIKGYDLGVDEYVSKPFSPKIIVKKVNAILKRQTKDVLYEEISMGIVSLDVVKMSVKVNGVELKLSKKEYDLMRLFITHPDQVFSRDQLLDKVWGYDYFAEDRVVDSSIKRLRKKLGPATNYLKTVFGVGYKFGVDEHA